MSDDWKSSEEWNEWVDQLARWNPLGYTGADDSGAGGHAWRVSAVWSPIDSRWECKVAPGFCNGRDVLASVIRDEVPVEVPLTDAPSVVLSGWRSIGGAGNVAFSSDAEKVPEFFKALGVQDAELITAESLDEGRVVDITAERLAGIDPASAPFELPERLLRAVDLVLRMERPRTVIDWAFGAGGVTNTTAQFSVGVVGSLAKNARLRVVSRFVELEAADDVTRLAGLANDSGVDEIRVATVFLVSPEDVGLDYPVGADWTPYVRHDLFWNAYYEHSGAVPSVAPQNLAVNVAGLGGAAVNAQGIVNGLLAGQNDAFAGALAFLSSVGSRGTFYTAGGRRPKTEALDPPFPFAGLAFKG